ncbi:MAG: hypothetical protein ACREIP_19790, partial [Alphaproteobacteria bacterium]
MAVLDDRAIDDGILLNLRLGCQEQARGPERGTGNKERGQVEERISELADADGISSMGCEGIVPRGAKIGAHFDEANLPARLDRGKDLASARGFMIRERRHGRRGRNQERVFRELGQERGLQQAVLAAAESRAAAGASDGRPRDLNPAIHDIDVETAGFDPGGVGVERVRAIPQMLEPELALARPNPQRKVDRARPEDEPMRVEA